VVLKKVQNLKKSLLSKGSELYVQSPNLPQKPMPRKRAMISVVSALATGLVLLLFVFIRKAMINASANPESAAKLASIRRSFGFRSAD
jgi:hypothetical protein